VFAVANGKHPSTWEALADTTPKVLLSLFHPEGSGIGRSSPLRRGHHGSSLGETSVSERAPKSAGMASVQTSGVDARVPSSPALDGEVNDGSAGGGGDGSVGL
jgi:hypothetical protein